MSARRQVPDPAAVAWWLRMLKTSAQGCIQPVPDPPLTRSLSRPRPPPGPKPRPAKPEAAP